MRSRCGWDFVVCAGEMPAGGREVDPAGAPAEVHMATHAAKQVVTSPRRPAASAGDPILTSKITAPEVPDWVIQRPRITELIAQGTRWCPVTVVTGPVGAGKTMALAMWAAAEPGPVAWVCLDEYNTRPGHAARPPAGISPAQPRNPSRAGCASHDWW